FGISGSDFAKGINLAAAAADAGRGVPVVSAYSPAVSDSPLDQMLDGDAISYWAGTGDLATFVLFLGEPRELGGVEVIWSNGSTRSYKFDILASLDGVNYELVYSGSSKPGAGPQEYMFTKPVKASFVKMVGYGNNTNQWTSVAEFAVLAKK
ncbi:MAG: discoidin domain-containing protein, partial [Victivallaceae bacterium]